MKFFKAFGANPRLKVVTDTLVAAAEDIVHFFVVFVTVLLTFVIIAHVLFGSDLEEFYTLASSLNTCFFVLMGDFGWYVELVTKTTSLPSAMSIHVLHFWFWTYMFFMLLVLLNMLLAVILERYSQVTSAFKGTRDAPPIWTQSQRFVKRWFATRGFMSLRKIRRLLEVDNDPAHPQDVVTAESLMAAFPGMKEKQANYIMHDLVSELKLQAPPVDVEAKRAKRTERFVHSIAEELRGLSQSLTTCTSRIGSLEGRLGELLPSEDVGL